jgi:adenylosuccinate synthase
MTKAHTVVKVGGAQGSHGVCTSRGERFAFSQWGCGTFEGIKTYLSPRMVISPEGILNEADALRYQCGVHNAFDLLTVDSMALCATPYHGIASRLKELARGSNPRGTIGTGVGEAYRYMYDFPELTIWAGELASPCIKDQLAEVREQIRSDLQEVIRGEFLEGDRDLVIEEVGLLNDDDFLDFVARRFCEVSQRVKIVDLDYLQREILSKDGMVVVESSHGVLTDRSYGFYPHTSALRTLPRFTHAMFKDAGYNGQIVNLGVTRAYAIRHGAGPMPTANPEMAESLLPGSNKDENRYQGKVRVGPFDFILLKYAIEVCGGPSAFDALAITWFDQIQTNGVWHLCDRYLNSNQICVWREEFGDQQKYQEALGKQLLGCKPETKRVEIAMSAECDDLFSLCADTLQCKLGVPVRMVSFGPTERDKVCK